MSKSNQPDTGGDAQAENEDSARAMLNRRDAMKVGVGAVGSVAAFNGATEMGSAQTMVDDTVDIITSVSVGAAVAGAALPMYVVGEYTPLDTYGIFRTDDSGAPALAPEQRHLAIYTRALFMNDGRKRWITERSTHLDENYSLVNSAAKLAGVKALQDEEGKQAAYDAAYESIDEIYAKMQESAWSWQQADVLDLDATRQDLVEVNSGLDTEHQLSVSDVFAVEVDGELQPVQGFETRKGTRTLLDGREMAIWDLWVSPESDDSSRKVTYYGHDGDSEDDDLYKLYVTEPNLEDYAEQIESNIGEQLEYASPGGDMLAFNPARAKAEVADKLSTYRSAARANAEQIIDDIFNNYDDLSELDLSDFLSPEERLAMTLTSYEESGSAIYALAIASELGYTTASAGGVQHVDYAPYETNGSLSAGDTVSLDLSGTYDSAVLCDNGYMYMMHETANDSSADVVAVNVSTGESQVVYTVQTTVYGHIFEAGGGRLLVGENGYVTVFDTSDPTNLTELYQIDDWSTGQFIYDDINDMAVVGGTNVVTLGDSGYTHTDTLTNTNFDEDRCEFRRGVVVRGTSTQGAHIAKIDSDGKIGSTSTLGLNSEGIRDARVCSSNIYIQNGNGSTFVVDAEDFTTHTTMGMGFNDMGEIGDDRTLHIGGGQATIYDMSDPTSPTEMEYIPVSAVGGIGHANYIRGGSVVLTDGAAIQPVYLPDDVATDADGNPETGEVQSYTGNIYTPVDPDESDVLGESVSVGEVYYTPNSLSDYPAISGGSTDDGGSVESPTGTVTATETSTSNDAVQGELGDWVRMLVKDDDGNVDDVKLDGKFTITDLEDSEGNSIDSDDTQDNDFGTSNTNDVTKQYTTIKKIRQDVDDAVDDEEDDDGDFWGGGGGDTGDEFAVVGMLLGVGGLAALVLSRVLKPPVRR